VTPPAAAAAAPAVHPRRTASPVRTRTAPARPRRVSGPAHPTRPLRPPGGRPGTAARPDGIAVGLLRLPRTLQNSRLLDRLVRGRTAIAFVAFALIGIVTLQLAELKLNSTIGHTLQREAQLQRENAALSIENSEMAAGDRVESRAVQLGMELVPVSALRFLSVRPGLDASRGAAALRTPVASATSGSPEATASATGASSSSGTAEATTSEAAASPSTGESSGAPSGEAQQASGEPAQQSPSEPASSAASAPAPASAPSSSNGSTAPTAPAEASPAGGTQAGPTG
jgi:cell division protein FtsL